MAYYTNLINAWNGATQPPAGVTGQALTGLTTAQKIAAVNAWTIAGPAISPQIPVRNVIAVIVPADFLALTALQLQELQFLLQGGDVVFAPSGGTVRSVFGTIFSGKATTLANLSALVAQYDAPPIPWYSAANGGALNGAVSLTDTQAAGLS